MPELEGPGYREIGTDHFIPDDAAYDYALERISQDEDLQNEFVDWFFSDNYIRED